MAIASEMSREKLQQALDLLQEAARHERGQLRELAIDKYGDLKTTLADLRDGVGERARGGVRRARELERRAEEEMMEVAGGIDRRVHSDPWPILAAVAAGTLVVGYLMGRGMSDGSGH